MGRRVPKRNGRSEDVDCYREARPPLQREVLREVMLSAAECQTWLTLDELAHLTGYPPASISAQLRHLRKERYGSYQLQKRCRKPVKFDAGVDARDASGPVWEYRIERQLRAMGAAGIRGGLSRGKAVATVLA